MIFKITLTEVNAQSCVAETKNLSDRSFNFCQGEAHKRAMYYQKLSQACLLQPKTEDEFRSAIRGYYGTAATITKKGKITVAYVPYAIFYFKP